VHGLTGSGAGRADVRHWLFRERRANIAQAAGVKSVALSIPLRESGLAQVIFENGEFKLQLKKHNGTRTQSTQRVRRIKKKNIAEIVDGSWKLCSRNGKIILPTRAMPAVLYGNQQHQEVFGGLTAV